jgi:hypothetical protein
MTKKRNAGLIVLALIAVVLSCLFTALLSVSGSSELLWGILVLACLVVFTADMLSLGKRLDR